MLAHSTLFLSLYNRVKDVLNIEGGNVSDVALDLINRAQNRLVMEHEWDGLKKIAALTISNKTASMPADFGREIMLYVDSDGDGKPEDYLYKDGLTNSGYRINATFTKAAGYTYTITFYETPSSTVYLVYMPNLTEFLAADITGAATYSFFPAEIMVKQALVIHMAESGEENNQYQILKAELTEDIRKFQAASQYSNEDFSRELKNSLGNNVSIDEDYLDGSGGYNANYEGDNSRWSR